jgi:hypothetical protein
LSEAWLHSILPEAQAEKINPIFSDSRDYFNFKKGVFGQSGDLDGRASGRRSGEISAVYFIHGCKIVQVLEENGGLDDVMEVGAGGLQNSLYVFQHSLGLLANVAAGQLSALRVESYLTGHENKSAGLDRLRVRADGLGSAVGADDISHWVASMEETAIAAEEAS